MSTPVRFLLNFVLSVVCIWFHAAAADAPQPRLRLLLPVACTLNRDCWVANYVDVDESKAARDFRCGPRTYDAHDGIDFAIRDLAAMRAGVTVRAAVDGVVRSVRDAMPDTGVQNAAQREAIRDRECGNGVLVEHDGGWQTQYCHLRRGSVRVRPGQAVQEGAPIGLVGLSGNTEFPHLHFALRLDGRTIDPFLGAAPQPQCGGAERPLWRSDAGVRYEPAAITGAGFSSGVPDIDAIRRGERDDPAIGADAAALVLWVDMLGVRSGDRLRFRISAPDGRLLFEHDETIERTQARRFVYAGTRRTAPAWSAGEYRGTIEFAREGSRDPYRDSVSVTISIASR